MDGACVVSHAQASHQGLARAEAVYVFAQRQADATPPPGIWTAALDDSEVKLLVECRVGWPACTLSAIQASKIVCGHEPGNSDISGLGFGLFFTRNS